MNAVKRKILFFIQKIVFRTLNMTKTINKNVKITGLSRGLNNVVFGGDNGIWERCFFSGSIEIGYGTTLGFNNFMAGNISIGKYSQIGSDVAIHSTNHPTNHLTTYINKNLFDGELGQFKKIETIKIGNDVWIGHNAIIVGSVTVGNGAIIGAGSVVTKDVPPYSIVAGVPAKVIRMRFNEKIIEEIEALKWWDKSKEELEEIKPLFFKDLNTVDSLYGKE